MPEFTFVYICIIHRDAAVLNGKIFAEGKFASVTRFRFDVILARCRSVYTPLFVSVLLLRRHYEKTWL